MIGRAPSDADRALIAAATVAIDRCTDGSDGVHTVGAAVRDVDGSVFVGVNLAHFTGGPCAELVALANARAGGAAELDTIVAVGNEGRGPIGPCGRDRQILHDYHPHVRVLLPTRTGVRSVAIADLLPEAMVWTPDPAGAADG